MVKTIARVAAIRRLEVPSFSMIASVASGAAKLTNSNCIMAKAPAPGTPKTRSTGCTSLAISASTPRASTTFISAIMITNTGSSTYSASSRAVFPDSSTILINSSKAPLLKIQNRIKNFAELPKKRGAWKTKSKAVIRSSRRW